MAAKRKDTRTAFQKLKPQTQATLLAYADPESPTYGNQTQSVLSAERHLTYQSAAVKATNTLKDAKVQSALTDLLETFNGGYEVRLRHLADLALDRHAQEVVTTQRNKDGQVIGETTVTKPVPAHVQLAAMAKISRDTGEDTVSRARNQVLSDKLLSMGAAMLRAHQGSASVGVDTDDITPESIADDSVDSASNDSQHVSKSITSTPTEASDTSSHGVHKTTQGEGDRERGKPGLPHYIPSPLRTFRPNSLGGPFV